MRLKLRCHRITAGMTINEMAKELGVIAITYRNYEYGIYTPKMKNAQIIAKLLGCSLEDVLEDISEVPEDLRYLMTTTDKLLKKMKKNSVERMDIQFQFKQSITKLKTKTEAEGIKMKTIKTENIAQKSKILAMAALFIVAAESGVDAGALAGYFTSSFETVVETIRVVGGLCGLLAGTWFFITLMGSSGGSFTGQAVKLLVAIGGAIAWSTGAATAVFSNLVTSGLCF